MSAIELVGVSKKFGQKSVLSDVNLKIARGEIAVVTGESGSGKTTLINIISGIEKADAGKIILNGGNLQDLTPKERLNFYRRSIGVIHQNFYLHPRLNVAQNIALPGVFVGLSRKERTNRIKVLAEQFRIEDILSSKPSEISGGQTERVCFARALFMAPQIIIADEPTNNLDSRNVDNLLRAIKGLNNATFVIVSHDKRMIDIADKTLEIREGAAYEIR